MPQFQLVDYFFIAVAFRAIQVIEQAAAFGDHFQEATPRRVILRVRLKVFGQLRNSFRQQRDLHIGAARILLMQLELLEIHRSRVLSHNEGRIVDEERRIASPPASGDQQRRGNIAAEAVLQRLDQTAKTALRAGIRV